MKKILLTAVFVLFAVNAFAHQPVVAVAPFNAISGISATDLNMITRVFYIRLGNTNKVSLVDRSVVEQVLKEHNFQTGDWSNKEKTAEMNKALNADWIVRGEMEKYGTNILVTVQFYDIRTFRFMGGTDLLLANANEAYDKIDPLVNKLIETIAENPAPVVYKVGDRGPGGGYIFFAENGVYMECSMDLGTYNWDNAMRVARNYKGGGFTDWRLPTKGELDLMHDNLKAKGLGGFNGHYWSSSEYNDTNAWIHIFNSGLQYYNLKSISFENVRAIRAF